MSSSTPRILIVEDNPGEALLVRLVLEELEHAAELEVRTNGGDVLQAVQRFAPHLILLDLHLPGKGGQEVLTELRANPVGQVVPVVVFSSSAAQADVVRCYAAGANTYFVKPSELESFGKTLTCILEYWFHTAELPADQPGERVKLPSLPHGACG